MFYIYLARCADSTLYCGYCRDLTARETAHNQGNGAKYTRARGPIKIVYSEVYDSKSAAMKREYAIKKLKRAAKERLITG